MSYLDPNKLQDGLKLITYQYQFESRPYMHLVAFVKGVTPPDWLKVENKVFVAHDMNLKHDRF